MPKTRDFRVPLALALLLSQILQLTSTLQSKENPQVAASLTEEHKIVHVLNRAGFGPRPGDVERVRRMGLASYLELQLHPSKIEDSAAESRLSELKTLTMSTSQLFEQYPPRIQRKSRSDEKTLGERQNERGDVPEEMEQPKTMALNGPGRIIGELGQAKLLRAVYSERQLLEVMVDFWTNHFNVFAAKGANKWLITAYDRDVIRPHALGKFKDLLEATAKSPAMLFYLDNWMSADPNASLDLSRLRELRSIRNRSQVRRRLDDANRSEGSDPKMDNEPAAPRSTNRKLGLNENYARELMELHTLGVDGGYTQQDIIEVARCLTGWTISRPRQEGRFKFARILHDDGEKTVLGHKIKPGGGIGDGERVLEILARHPSTAKFIAFKLARRFVSDEPGVDLVGRVADVFKKTDGDITAMLQAIFNSPEFNSPAVYRAKVKTPFELVASSIRALGAETQGGVPLLRAVAQMGEPLYLCQPPTGYSDVAEAWVSTGALVNRLNFGLSLAGNRLPGTRVNLESLVSSLSLSQSSQDLLQRLAAVILQGDMSPATLETLKKQMQALPTDKSDDSGSTRSIGPTKIAALLLGSPEFQRQ
jgi:uncharacterized protein (DUF1800 family)